MSSLKLSSSTLKPNRSFTSEKRKTITLVQDYTQLKHNLSRSITVEPSRRDYVTQGHWESFLSYEDPSKDIMSAFLILRNEDPNVPNGTSLIYELRVYESIIPLVSSYEKKAQNQALGIHLVQWAESVAIQEHNSTEIAMVCTEDNKHFFKMLGYESKNGSSYLYKSLNPEEYRSAFQCTDGPDLKFDENKNIIKLEVDPEKEEDEWLRHFDYEYKLHKAND